MGRNNGKKFVKGMGALYLVYGNGESKKVLKDVTLSNGICWSPDEKNVLSRFTFKNSFMF